MVNISLVHHTISLKNVESCYQVKFYSCYKNIKGYNSFTVESQWLVVYKSNSFQPKQIKGGRMACEKQEKRNGMLLPYSTVTWGLCPGGVRRRIAGRSILHDELTAENWRGTTFVYLFCWLGLHKDVPQPKREVKPSYFNLVKWNIVDSLVNEV